MIISPLKLAILAAATVGILAIPVSAEDPLSIPSVKAGESQEALDAAALTRRIEDYSDTKKGEVRAAEDQLARTGAQEFIASLIAKNTGRTLAASSLPYVHELELIPDEAELANHFSKYRLPGAFAKGDQRITLLSSLEELEKAVGKRFPEATRKRWTGILTDESRIAVVQGGPILLGISLRRTKSEYRVSGLLFTYFPIADDPLQKVITKDPLAP